VSKRAAPLDIEVRPMEEADLDAVLEITNEAFRGLVEKNTGPQA
jgi:hypothetical protein